MTCENIAHARVHGKRGHGRVKNIASLVDFQSLKSRSRENHEALVCRFLLLRERAIRRLRYVSGISSNIEIPSTSVPTRLSSSHPVDRMLAKHFAWSVDTCPARDAVVEPQFPLARRKCIMS
jgi:hypothetical protein